MIWLISVLSVNRLSSLLAGRSLVGMAQAVAVDQGGVSALRHLRSGERDFTSPSLGFLICKMGAFALTVGMG